MFLKTLVRLLVTITCAGAILALSQSPTASSNPSVPNPVSFRQGLGRVTRAVDPNPWPQGLIPH